MVTARGDGMPVFGTYEGFPSKVPKTGYPCYVMDGGDMWESNPPPTSKVGHWI